MSVIRVKALFFDSAAVKGLVDAKTRVALSRFGSFTRRTAKGLLRYSKGSSPAGVPPKVHRTLRRTKTNRKGEVKTQSVSPLREFIFFSYDPERKSVVIGPVPLGGKAGPAALDAIEHGGTSPVEIRRNGAKVTILWRVEARPFMAPAFAKELPNAPKLWA